MKKPLAYIVGEWLASCPLWQLFSVFSIFGLIVFAGAISHPFVHDDIFFLVENPALRHFDFWKTLVHPLDMKMAGIGVNMYYRPLLDWVNHGQYLLYGFDPHAFHLFNILVHIFNSFLVFSILLRILTLCSGLTRERGRWIAIITSVIFLIHPVQTQAVDCVSGISNLLFAFLGLSAFLLYLEFRRADPGLRANIFYASSLMLLALAVLAKEQALVFPLLIAWFEFCFFKSSSRTALWKVIAGVAGWFLIIAAYLLFKKYLMGALPLTGGHLFTPEFWLRVLNIPRIFLINLGLILVPHDLHYFRSINILDAKTPSMIALFVLMVVGAVSYRRMPEGLRQLSVFGWGWFVWTQLLTINIVPLIWEYSYVSVAEHFLYLPMMGVVLVCAAVFLEYVSSGWKQEWKAVVMIVVITALSLITIGQHYAWRSEVDLFERAARYQPNLGRVQMLLGKAYYDEWRFPSAIEAYTAARDRMMFYEQKAFGESQKQFYRVIRKDIDRGLAVSEQALGNYGSAEKYFLEALDLVADDAGAHNDLGVLYTVMGKNDLALDRFQKSLEINPDDEIFMRNYALALDSTGEKEKAVAFIQEQLSRHSTDGLRTLLSQIQQAP